MSATESLEKELQALEYIYHNQDAVKQRDLAQIINVSVGMINAIFKRLARKGWLMIRKVNNRNIQYIVSPAGAEAIARRSYRYFKRTIKNVVFYKEVIENVVIGAKRQGYSGLYLVGYSDLDYTYLSDILMNHGG